MSFADQVYELTSKVPKGKVTTYKEIATKLGVRAYRAVGNALRHNPYAPEVPCHRVIKSDRTIGGFVGQVKGPEVERKIRMLKEEGVTLENGRVPETMVHKFS